MASSDWEVRTFQLLSMKKIIRVKWVFFSRTLTYNLIAFFTFEVTLRKNDVKQKSR